mgnify:CR=1
MAVQDTGSRYVKAAFGQLRRIGGRVFTYGYCGSYVLAGCIGTGRRPHWVKEVQRKRGKGPSMLSVTIVPPRRSGQLINLLFIILTKR